MLDTAVRAIEYRFNYAPAARTCPVCTQQFEPAIGMWPFAAGSDDAVCGGDDCASARLATGPQPCAASFEFADLAPATIRAIREADPELSVAERFRGVSLHDGVPEDDRKLLQLAAIDLQYCQAEDTRIEAFEPRLLLRTCGEAAAELLLSGCGEIL